VKWPKPMDVPLRLEQFLLVLLPHNYLMGAASSWLPTPLIASTTSDNHHLIRVLPQIWCC
jgi:hypothetical protein